MKSSLTYHYDRKYCKNYIYILYDAMNTTFIIYVVEYLLSCSMETTSSATLSVQGAASSLKKMSMTTNFKLNDLETGETLFADSVSGDATLGAVSSFYGQDKSESHARERLATLLAQRVGHRLQLYFLRKKQ